MRSWSAHRTTAAAVMDVDEEPPRVVSITPDLNAAMIRPCEEPTTVQVTFSERVVGADDAANYSLTRAGLDGLLGTGDDVSIALIATYDQTTSTATLGVPALPEDVYRLEVRDTITDMPVRFEPADTFGSGGDSPSSVTTGDFNGDGRIDLAVANGWSDNVGVLLGDGAGSFSTAVTFASGGDGPSSVTVGDFNGDGRLDLAVANSDGGNIGVLLGNGTGSFNPAVTFDSGGNSPNSVTAGDFNGDGRLDLAVANVWSDNVGVLLGDGAGSFSAAATFVSGGSAPASVTTGDFNGDGQLDLAVANRNSWFTENVGVLLGDGTGSFHPAAMFGSGGSLTSSVTTGDFNGDGRLDLAVANARIGSVAAFDGNVGVLLGDGMGIFSPAVTFGNGGSVPTSLTTGDFNGDGWLDLAIGNWDSDKVGVLPGTGTGSFKTTTTFGGGGNSVSTGDFNGDGQLDLAVANVYSDHVGVLLGGPSPRLLPLDGNADGVAGDYYVRDFVALSVGGSSTPFGTGGYYPSSVTAADLNGDGRLDLAVANANSDNVGVRLANASGSFDPAVMFGSGGFIPTSVTTGDFSGDGWLDLAVVNEWNDSVGVLVGDGAGSFNPAVTFGSGGDSGSVTTGDFNADGRLDLAVANEVDDNVGVLLANGTGSFNAAVNFGSGGKRPNFVATADLNGDGWLDLIVANGSEGGLGVLLGKGTGSFNAAVNFDSGGCGPTSVATGDLNGDGRLDLAVANAYDNVGVLLGNGTGSFSTAVTFGSGGDRPISVATGDLNGDGRIDLAVANANSDNVGVLLGDGTGNFADAVTFGSGGDSVSSVTTGDFDGDGWLDLAVANYYSDNVGVLLGPFGIWPLALVAPGGYGFLIQVGGRGAGQLVDDASNAFEGLNRLQVGSDFFSTALRPHDLSDAGRTLTTPSQTLSGLDVWREITVPDVGTEAFARTVDVLQNPTDGPVSTTVRLVGNLGSDAATTVFATGDGDLDVETTDQWIGTDGGAGGGPAVIHYIHGPFGVQPSAVAVLGDNIEWTYNLTVPAHQTARLAHFTILADDRTAAMAAADALVTPAGFGGQAAAFLSQEELNSLVSFDTPPVADAGGPYSSDEGAQIQLDASDSYDPNATGGDSIVAYRWDLDGDGQYDDARETDPLLDLTPGQLRELGLGDGPVNRTIGLWVMDRFGATATDTATLTINNVAPTVDAGPNVVIAQGRILDGYATFTDPGADTWTATVNYGDGTGDQPLVVAPATKTLQLYHTYAANGTYEVTVTVDDGDGGRYSDTMRASLGLSLTGGPVVAGKMTFTVLNATPGGLVNFAMGTKPGTGRIKIKNQGPITLDVRAPKVVAKAVADANGRAVAVIDLTKYAGKSIYLQAFEEKPTRQTSNLMAIAVPPPPQLSIADVTVRERDRQAVFTVTLSAVTHQAVRVRYATSDGTAKAGSDYTAKSGWLTIPAGESSGTISVAIRDDTRPEADEVLYVKLWSAKNSSLARRQAQGTIRNDDLALRLAATPGPGNAGGTLTAEQLAAVTDEAIRRWTLAVGEQAAGLSGVKWELTDSPGGVLGVTSAPTVYIDHDAAGRGWFVDGSPWDDEEFLRSRATRELRARRSSPAVDRVDLLTAVMHELAS
jgi:hypothetical protein